MRSLSTPHSHARLVRGAEAPAARFGFSSFPIPRFPRDTKSLYELQEMARHGLAT